MEARTETVQTVAPTEATLPALLAAGTARGGELTIIGESGPAETRSYARLFDEASVGAGALRSRGVRPGDRVALVGTTSFDFLIGCLAAWNAAAVVVPVPQPLAGRLSSQALIRATKHMLEKVAPRAVFVSSEYQPSIPEGTLVLTSSDLASGGRARAGGPAPEDASVIQFTSGSISAPRGVVLSHRAVVAHTVAYGGDVHYEPGDRVFSWLPLYHDLGLFDYLIVPMMFGVPVTLMPTRLFLADPGRWLVEFSRSGSTICAAPNFAYGLVCRHIRKGLDQPVDLSRTKMMGSGGEFINPVTVRTFLELAGPLGLDPLAFRPGYGLAEATCTVTARGVGFGFAADRVDRSAIASGVAAGASDADEGTAEFASVGPPLPGLEVKASGSNEEDLGERRVGEILVRGPSLMSGYLGDPEGTEAVFADGWLRTGDLGYLAGGELYITGRAKDVIIVRGQNYYAEDIERIAERVPGVRKGCCAAVPVYTGTTEAIALIAETRLESAEEQGSCRKELARTIWAETGLAPKKVLLVSPGSLPKTTSGKLQRSRARRLLDGNLSTHRSQDDG